MTFPIFNILKKNSIVCEGNWGDGNPFVGPNYSYNVIRGHTWLGDTYKIEPPPGVYSSDFSWTIFQSEFGGIQLLMPQPCRGPRPKSMKIQIRARSLQARYQIQIGLTNVSIIDTNANDTNIHRFGQTAPVGVYQEIFWDLSFSAPGIGSIIFGRQNSFGGRLEVDWWKVSNI